MLWQSTISVGRWARGPTKLTQPALEASQYTVRFDETKIVAYVCKQTAVPYLGCELASTTRSGSFLLKKKKSEI